MAKSDFFLLLSPKILPFAVIKYISHIKTYFQSIYIIFAIYSFIKLKLFKNKYFGIITTFILLNAFPSYYYSESINALKYIQLVSLFLIFFLCKSLFSESDFIRYSKISVVLATLISVYNFFLMPNNPYKFRTFLEIPRIPGISGEPNFTVLVLALPCLIFYFKKDYRWLLLAIANLLCVQSRSALVFFLVFLLLAPCTRLSKNLYRAIIIIVASLVIFSPIIFSTAYKLSNNKTKELLTKKVSTRFYLSKYYSEVGIEHPLGVGLAQGRNFYLGNSKMFRLITKRENNIHHIENAEQHSLYSQILSEFGIVYFIFVYLAIIAYLIKNKNRQLSIGLVSIFSILMFINGLNELTLYISCAYFSKET